MNTFFAPLLRPACYTRWLHLLVGGVFAGVVSAVYPGITGRTVTQIVIGTGAVSTVLLGLAALVPATRHGEGVQARLLLMPDREGEVGVEPSRGWSDRWRTALWLFGRVVLGTAVLIATVHTFLAVVRLCGAPFSDGPVRPYDIELPSGEARLWYPLVGPVLLLGLGWLVVWGGRLQLVMAERLLGPSPAERLAAAELQAERLLERNLLARELHDSIGHALTVTVLQAGAAREIAEENPQFVRRALQVIEETGRQAMEDLERTLVLLRATPDGGTTERPGLDQVVSLFETARAAGSPVEARIGVSAGVLPGVLSREAYRIVQEGVTNALRHAPGAPLRVSAALREGQVELRCVNASSAGGRSGPGGSGKGLRGIRERAVLLGGEAGAGPEGGEWVLWVRLPVRLGA